MAMVCENCFIDKPEGFYLENYLKDVLDVFVKSIKNDMDFVILISGHGEVRIGKSVLAMQIAYYLNNQIEKVYNIKNTFDIRNFKFNGKDLIEYAKTQPKYNVNIYDEAGADLIGRKMMIKNTQDVLDYLRECGQLNHFSVFVIPDFFELPKSIAITRSACLIDVKYKKEFQRGSFNFYGKDKKKLLYQKGKKLLDYYATTWDFHGTFSNFYTVNEDNYRKIKKEALQGREIKKPVVFGAKQILYAETMYNAIQYLSKIKTQKEVAEILGISQDTVSRWFNKPNFVRELIGKANAEDDYKNKG
jgi:DNA-binding XRE family transcriptional regulator